MKPLPLLLSLCLGLFLTSLAPLNAQNATPDPFETLDPDARAAYLQWRKAQHEADLVYLSRLEAALTKATKSGRLDDALAIKAEIARVRGTGNGANPGTGGPQATDTSLTQFLVGTTWRSGLNGATVTFKADGKAVRSHGGRNTDVSYRITGATTFDIIWTQAVGRCQLAADRKQFKSGDVMWTLVSEARR